LLEKDQSKRLGAGELDFVELRDHIFFAEINWLDLVEKRIPVPWTPELESTKDLKHIDPEFTREQVPGSLGTSLIGQRDNAFKGFTYVNNSGFI
jgi:hypothetical protein